MRYETVTAPSGEPVSLEAARTQARVDGTDEDAYLQGAVIPGVRRATETYLRRQIRSGAYRALLTDGEQLGDLVVRGYGPVVVTAVTYLDADGARQTVPQSSYGVCEVALGSRLSPVSPWPKGTGYQIEFGAGFDEVPEDVVLAMQLLVAEFYANREVSKAASLDAAVSAYHWLLDGHRCGIGL